MSTDFRLLTHLPHALSCHTKPQVTTIQDQFCIKGMFPRLVVVFLLLGASLLLQSKGGLLLVQDVPLINLLILCVLSVYFDAIVFVDFIVIPWRNDFCSLLVWLFELLPGRLVRQVHE